MNVIPHCATGKQRNWRKSSRWHRAFAAFKLTCVACCSRRLQTFTPLKIALVILHADPARGGAERYTVDLASSLRQHGHDARLVSGSFEAGTDPTLNVLIQSGHGSRLQRYEHFLHQAQENIAGERYDI